MMTNENPAAVRVCAIADIECSRGCGTGACKREQPAAAPTHSPECEYIKTDNPWAACTCGIGSPNNPAPSPADERATYGSTDFGYTFVGIDLEEGDKRLMALLVRALGTDHPAIEDMTALLFRARAASANETGAEAHKLLAALIDIYDDERNNAPEDRCYIEGAWTETINEARAFLVFYPSAAPQPVQADARVGLTDEQRAILTQAADFLELKHSRVAAQTLRALLARGAA